MMDDSHGGLVGLPLPERDVRLPLPERDVGLPLPERDVRRKRPPMLSFLLRLETLRWVARVLSLLVLDFVGVMAALLTALLVKLTIKGQGDLALAWSQTRAALAFAYLVTVLMFARVDLYADRP